MTIEVGFSAQTQANQVIILLLTFFNLGSRYHRFEDYKDKERRIWTEVRNALHYLRRRHEHAKEGKLWCIATYRNP